MDAAENVALAILVTSQIKDIELTDRDNIDVFQATMRETVRPLDSEKGKEIGEKIQARERS